MLPAKTRARLPEGPKVTPPYISKRFPCAFLMPSDFSGNRLKLARRSVIAPKIYSAIGHSFQNSQALDERIRFRVEVSEPGYDFDKSLFVVSLPLKYGPADSGQGKFFDEDYPHLGFPNLTLPH